jgi:hypothetical protein
MKFRCVAYRLSKDESSPKRRLDKAASRTLGGRSPEVRSEPFPSDLLPVSPWNIPPMRPQCLESSWEEGFASLAIGSGGRWDGKVRLRRQEREGEAIGSRHVGPVSL